MIYCQKCGTKNPKGSESCKKCGASLPETLVDGNERPLVQKLHQAENVYREKKDSAMSFIVIGSILLILGAIFFVLSFKLPTATAANKVLITSCFEFWVSMVGLIGGGGCLIYGLTLLFLCLNKLKELKEDIVTIRAEKSPVIPETKKK